MNKTPLNVIQEAHSKHSQNPTYFYHYDWKMIDLVSTCHTSRYKRLGDALATLCKATGINPTSSNKNILKVLLLSLSRCLNSDSLIALAYPCDRDSIKRLSKERHPIPITPQLEVIVKALVKHGYLYKISGNAIKLQVSMFQGYNRVLITEKLWIEILDNFKIQTLPLTTGKTANFVYVRKNIPTKEGDDEIYTVTEEEEREAYKNKETIAVPLASFKKDEEKKLLKESQQFLQKYNQLLVNTSITLNGKAAPNANTYVNRYFCRGDLKHGGRLYGGFWQNLKGGASQRKHILINGRKTVELDYQAIHINMMYASEGKEPLKEDPYSNIGSYDRKLVKACILVAINARTNSSKSILNHLRSKPELRKYYDSMCKGGYKKLLDEFVEKHPVAEKYLHKDAGVKLQKLDSDIAIGVIKRMMNPPTPVHPKPIPILSIHDSFICPVEHEETLKMSMIGAFEEVMGTTRAPIIS